MRRLLIEILIDTLVVALLFPFLPGIEIVNATFVTYILIGLILSLLSRLLKPILFLVAGRLVIWNIAVWLLVLNLIIFLLTAWRAPSEWISDGVLWVILDAMIVSLVMAATDAVLGFNRPDLDPENRRQVIWRLIERLPTTQRSRLIENLRIQQLYDTFYQYGLEIALANTGVRSLRERASRWISGRANTLDQLTTPQKVRLMLEQLGPMYVKVGQIVSSQSLMLPEEWREELDKLQSTVQPFPYEEARQIIVAELGAPPEQLFATFDRNALAAASTAQVHRATLQEGCQVAVKVQRPNIIAKVSTDLRIMGEVAKTLERRFDWARDLDLSGLVSEFAAGVHKELNYRNEAYHTIRLRDNLASISGVHVPTIYRQLSTSRVLTMEYIDGVKISKIREHENRLDMAALARTFERAIMKQILIDGFFHGDPHPGNLFISPQTGVITFLDLGLIGELRTDQRLDLIDLMFSLQQGDSYSVAQAIRRLSVQARPMDDVDYFTAVERILSQEWKYGTGDSFGAMMNKVMAELSHSGLRMNKQLTLAVKAIGQSEEVTNTLEPGIDQFTIAVDEIKSLSVQQFTPERIVAEAETQLIRAGKELVRRLPSLPEATIKWVEQYQRGRFSVELDTGDLTQRLEELSGSITNGLRNLSIGLILTGMLISSAIAVGFLQQFSDESWLYVYIAIVIAFLVVLIYGAVVVTMMVRASRRERPRL
jgi:ubiquinone biosynthesis protein